MAPHFIKLTYKYRLYAFATYQDMAAAKEQLPHVVLAKEFSKLKEIEAKNYVHVAGSTSNSYRNYLETNPNLNQKATGVASIITALQVLYKLNGYSATYIVITRC